MIKKFFWKMLLLSVVLAGLFPSISQALLAIQVNQGGTGVSTVTGILQGNGINPFSAITIGAGLTFSGGTLSSASGAGTLAAVSANSTDATKSLYTMTSTIPVEFKTSGGTHLLYLDESNAKVGIGIAAPESTLHVKTSLNGSAGIWVSDPGGQYIILSSSNGATGYPYLGTISNSQLSIGTNNNESMHFLTSGYVGIGTTNPQANLSLGSDVSAQKLLLYDSGNVRYGMGIASGELRIFSPGTGNHISLGSVSATDGSTWSEKMRIDGGTGYVGIGATTLSSLLHLYGATGAALNLITEPVGWLGLKHRFGVPYSGDTLVVSANALLTSATAGSLDETSTAATALILGQGTFNIVRASAGANPRTFTSTIYGDTSGNVGIGTSPSTTLDIFPTSGNGTFRLTRSSSQTYGFQATAVDSNGDVYLDSIGDHANPIMYFRMRSLGTPLNVLSLDASSNVSMYGKMALYNNIATVSNGIPSELATIDSTGLTANVGATTLYSVPASGAGMYRVSAYLVTTTAASVSSTMPNAQVVFTDKDSNTSVTMDVSPILGAAGLGQTGLLTANTVGTVFTGVVTIYAKASTTIQYQTVNYASTAAGMAYSIHIKLEAL